MKKLTELKTELKKVQNKYTKLRQAVEDVELKLELPNLKKKYEGKFYKYQNSTGTDKKWWLYSYCKKVLNQREAICDRFESSPYENEFRNNATEYFYTFEIEITRREYIKALSVFVSKCKELELSA